MEEEDEEAIRLVNHFSLWRRKMRKRSGSGLLTTLFLWMEEDEEEIRSVNHFSLWMREIRKRSGLITTSRHGGGR